MLFTKRILIPRVAVGRWPGLGVELTSGFPFGNRSQLAGSKCHAGSDRSDAEWL